MKLKSDVGAWPAKRDSRNLNCSAITMEQPVSFPALSLELLRKQAKDLFRRAAAAATESLSRIMARGPQYSGG